MAQSAVDVRKTLLHNNAFWEKPTVTSPFSWDKWTQQWKLTMLAKERIQLETLLNGPPPSATYPPEPIYEEPVENHTESTDRDRKVCNQQLKLNWQNRSKKVDEFGILRGDKHWEHCAQKAKSLLYLCIGTEGCCIFKSIYPYLEIEKDSLKEFGRVMEDSFTKTRNNTNDRFVFFSSKQQKGESVESFHGRLIEQAE